jgi:hypothetical protein
MEIIQIAQVASVDLAEVRVSADELIAYEAALSYLLDTLPAQELERRLGASRDEIEGIREDLRHALAACGASTLQPTLS